MSDSVVRYDSFLLTFCCKVLIFFFCRFNLIYNASLVGDVFIDFSTFDEHGGFVSFNSVSVTKRLLGACLFLSFG